MIEAPAGDDLLRVLPEDGRSEVDVSDLGLDPARLRELYRLMLLVRRADLEATALQRQGELAVYPPLLGQEAAQVGSAFALEPTDWIFPSYRELGAAVVRGVDLVEYLHFYRATWHGGTYDANAHRFGYVAVPVASQILHAVGVAMGATLDGLPDVAMAYFGDGATSEGDFHEGCNFAGVFRAPVVFFCQNNQWAISVPLAHQTAAPIWRKAEAYGFPGVRVDGNDVLAVYRATRDAVARAREGVPTLIEAVTYRMGPHSTADDATRYQPADEIERWKARDPVDRYAQLARGDRRRRPGVLRDGRGRGEGVHRTAPGRGPGLGPSAGPKSCSPGCSRTSRSTWPGSGDEALGVRRRSRGGRRCLSSPWPGP